MAPGAFHQARWLSKALYTLKIWLFRNQFRLTAPEENRLQDVCIFIVRTVHIYIKAGVVYCSPCSFTPNNDLMFLQLAGYKSISTTLSKVASSKFAGHLWYLNEVGSCWVGFI